MSDLIDIREHDWGHTGIMWTSRCNRCGYEFNARDGMPSIPSVCWSCPPSDPHRADGYYRALCAVLLFHSPSLWTDTKRLCWMELTGSSEATTKVLCDTVRKALG